MRNLLSILLMLLAWVFPAQALSTPASAFLSKLPLRPPSPCSQKREAREQFTNQVSITERLDEDIREREQVIKDAKRRDSKKMQEAVMDQPGFQGIDEETMKRMSREQRKKKAEQMMEQKYGVSMEEINNLKKMKNEGNVEGIKGWGNAFTAEQQATAAMDPEKAAKTQQKNMGTAHLAFGDVTISSTREGQSTRDGQVLQASIEGEGGKSGLVTHPNLIQNGWHETCSIARLAPVGV